MTGSQLVRHLCWMSLLSFVTLQASGQERQQDRQQDRPGSVLTLGVQSRLVIEDVLVTDAHGKPVHGLPASAFHVFDQDRPQTLRSFEEGEPPSDEMHESATRALPPGVFSNDRSSDPHTASEVLLIDADDMAVLDQMFLLNQLQRSIAALPPGLQVAVFRVSGGRAVQIRGMSTDRDDLRRALAECLPVLTHTLESNFQSAMDQLMTVTAYLEQTPGRKNVLWFAGAFPLVPVSDDEQIPGSFTVDYAARLHVIHQVQEALAEARISVYPVDVRGVLTSGLAMSGDRGRQVAQTRDPAAAAGFSRTPVVAGPGGGGDMERRDQMRQLATATGGKAYMLNNLAEEIGEAFDLGVRAYTLAYTPTAYATDDSWHRIKITVDGNYQLSYRPGYLAAWTGMPGGRQGFQLEDGERIATHSDAAHDARQPILFTVKIEPMAEEPRPNARRGQFKVALTFQVPTSQLSFEQSGGRWRNELLVCSYAYNSSGKMEGGKLQELDTSLTDEQWQRAQKQQVPARQEILVPRNAGYLLMAVRDKRSKRIGTFLLSMRAVRALPAAVGTSVLTPPEAHPDKAEQIKSP